MQTISLEESQKTLLNLAAEVAAICEYHHIPFFMVGGTMLGAIRHKGFIPWDDDMDFGVYYSDFWRLIDILKKELPSRYRCVCYEDKTIMNSFFFKVEDLSSVIDDPCYAVPLKEKLGLCIDVFPILKCDGNDVVKKAKSVNKIYLKWQHIFAESTSNTWYKSLLKKIFRSLTFSKPIDYPRKIKVIIDSVLPGNQYCNITSPQFWKLVWERDIFENLVLYDFETTKFLGPKNFDVYLSSCYKNYMALPPIEKRRSHAVGVYKR